MKKRIIAAIAGGVWLAGIGSAAALTYDLDRPLVLIPATSSRTLTAGGSTQLLEAAHEETTVESSAVVMPEATIVAYPSSTPPGATEMQGTTDLIIGPGVVTHPPRE